MSGYYRIDGKPGEFWAEAWMGNRPHSDGGPFTTAEETVKWLTRHGVPRDYTAEWLKRVQEQEALNER